jgi:DNA modification methylase
MQLINGDCRAVLPALPEQSVHCCVTSPPYFGLRDYGHDGQIGLEQTPDAFVQELVEVFREVRRVLRDDGTLWLNLGDSYAGAGPSGATYQSETTKRREGQQQDGFFRLSKTLSDRGLTYADKKPVAPPGFKKKDLIGIPWRVAFALQADGWYLRQDIIWHKPNPMPESVRDRCTKAHEYIFLLSKSPRYYFDSKAMLEEAKTTAPHKHWTEREHDQSMLANKQANGSKGRPVGVAGYSAPGKRNRRSVWTVATRPFKGAHFATFPPDLIEPCILAGCPAGGTVLDPFNGAGTTGVVALKHGRDYLGIELNLEYLALSEQRLAGTQPQLQLVAGNFRDPELADLGEVV